MKYNCQVQLADLDQKPFRLKIINNPRHVTLRHLDILLITHLRAKHPCIVGKYKAHQNSFAVAVTGIDNNDTRW